MFRLCNQLEIAEMTTTASITQMLSRAAKKPLETATSVMEASSLTSKVQLYQLFTCGVAPAVAMLSRMPVSACMFFIL